MFRKILYLIIAMVLAAIAAFADSLKFVQVSDVHYPKENVLGYENRSLEFAKENFKRLIPALNNLDVQYVFFTGDCTDQSFKEVFDDFFAQVDNLNKPFYIALGNHDSNTPQGFTKKDTLAYLKEKTPYRQSGANYFVQLDEKFIAVILDGSSDVGIDARGYYSKDTLVWLENVLNENKDKYVLIFQHFPIVKPCGEDAFFNNHSTKKKGRYVRLIKRNPNIVAIFSGHYHVAGEFEKYGIKHYSTPALFLKPSYYRFVEINYDKDKIDSIKTELVEN